MSSPTALTNPLPISPNQNISIESHLSTLTTSLRASLNSSQTLLASQSTRLATLTENESQLAHFRDQLTFLTAAKEAVESQLKEEIRKRECAEEMVDLLRGQVEQARRGVGMLQMQEKERKRLSTLPPPAIGLGLGPGEEEVGEGEREREREKAVSRQSQARGHKRISSQSEADGQILSTSPNPGAGLFTRTPGLRELRLGHGAAASNSPMTNFEDQVPVQVAMAPPMTKATSSSSSPSTKDTSVQEEATRLRGERAGLLARLAESEEARMASEICLRALREFMASGSGDPSTLDLGESSTPTAELLRGIRLPPLPTDRDTDETSPEPTKEVKQSGWGFKLWKQPTSPASTIVEPPATPHGNLSPPAGPTPRLSPLPTPGDAPTESDVAGIPNATTPLSSFVAGGRGV